MNNNLKLTIVALVVLVLLIAAYIAVNVGFSSDEETNLDDIFATTEYLWDESPTDIKSINYSLEDSNYTINSGENLTLEGYESIILSSSELSKAVSKICMIPVKRFVEVSKENFGKYGFDNSKNVITLTFKDGKIRTLVLGIQTGVANEVYALDKENSVVCTISSDYYKEYTKSPKEYRSRILCTLSNLFIRELTVRQGDKVVMSITNADSYEDYKMVYPYKDAVVSGVKISEFLSMFNQLEADAVVEENPTDISKYGFDNCLSVYIFDSAEKHTFKFGDLAPEGGMYIMYSDRPVVYRGSCFLYELFKDVKPVDYLEPYVHSYDISEVTSVEVAKGDKSYTMEISGEGDEVSYKINSSVADRNFASALFYEISGIYYGAAAEDVKLSDVYCTITFSDKNGNANKYVYYDYNKDYCIVRSQAGFNCMVLKTGLNNIVSSMAEFN